VVEDTVAGIFVRRGKFLVERRRSDDDSDPGFLAIPGGHVEKDESLHEALQREMKEELGVNIGRITRVYLGLHETTKGEHDRIHYFLIDSWRGRIIPHEAESLYWESDIHNLTATCDRKAMKRVLQSAA
jgi:8-oxo-dGTP pyrophosphatase MutT (NUDIX family)